MPKANSMPILKPEKKIGANKPCWCRSGKKFKKCHRDRESQPSINPYDLYKKVMLGFKEKYCSHPDASPKACSSAIIKAHTISRKVTLKTIAEDGHVYSILPKLANSKPNNDMFAPEFIFKKIGTKKSINFQRFLQQTRQCLI